MLVLSRRPDQQILFPNLDITLQVLQVRGKVVKIGIQAPEDVHILRPEAAHHQDRAVAAGRPGRDLDRHHLRNRLNTINLALHLFQKQSDAGLADDAEQTFQRVIKELQTLDSEVGAGKEMIRTAVPKRPPRLLVVEDDENERELLAGLLRLHGFRVDSAVDGRDALEYLDTHDPPDYVLLDMKMPNVDGAQAIDRIRGDERLAHLKVFAVSGTSPQELGVPAGPQGFDGWFAKPVDPERLIQAIAASDRAGAPSCA